MRKTRLLDRKPKSTLRLVLLADTHELHREVEVPDGDVLVHAGDFTCFSRSLAAIQDFDDWLGELPHEHKLLVPGNHEFCLATDPSRRPLLNNATILINKAFAIDGLRLWGSPVTPLANGAFGMAVAADRKRLYSQIPADTDVLVTHGPPFGILDRASEDGPHSGCRELFDAVRRIRPKLHAFGHVHGAYGLFQTAETTFANVALLGRLGELESEPLVLDMRTTEENE